MEKIVIIGSSGAGKSTLARNLGSLLKIRVIHLDRLFWRRGWEKISREKRIDILQNFAMEKQWIIEGTYPLSSEPVLHAADTVIFLDMPLFLCLRRVIQRHREEHDHRRDLPEGCPDKLDLHLIWKVLTFPLQDKRTFQQMFGKPEQEIIQLHSPAEVEAFLTRLEQMADDEKDLPLELSLL